MNPVDQSVVRLDVEGKDDSIALFFEAPPGKARNVVRWIEGGPDARTR